MENSNDLKNKIKVKSIGVKIVIIGILMIALLIPSEMIRGLITERQMLRDQAVSEVSASWGGKQTVVGPILKIPYRKITYLKTSVNNNLPVIEENNFAYFLPEDLKIKGTMNPEVRKRGIYEVVLYNTKLTITGSFAHPDFSELSIAKENINFPDASLFLAIPYLNGVKDNLSLKWNGNNYQFTPGVYSDENVSNIKINKIALAEGTQKYDFEMTLNLNGSERLDFLPIGKTTSIDLESTWQNPSFIGSFLPEKRDVTSSGFSASWNIFQYNREIPQKWAGSKFSDALNRNATQDFIYNRYANSNSNIFTYNSEFGVSLLLPVDQYQQTMRSVKYDILFIFLTFLIYFFIEIFNKKKIHPIQYALVGFAIVLFYVLLLSIAEFLRFEIAYAVSSLLIVLLVSLYSISVFKSRKKAIFAGLFLAMLYIFFYILLQLQEYSLLVGSLGLFAILGIVMYLSRNIDWYNIGSKDEV